MHSKEKLYRPRLPVTRPVAVLVALLLLGLFVVTFFRWGVIGVRGAMESLLGGPTSADLELLPRQWRSDTGVRAYLVDDERIFDFNFANMAKGAQYARPGEGECFAAIGVIRGLPSGPAAAAIVSDWFAGAPPAIADETIAWIKRHHTLATDSLKRPVDDRHRIFWRELVIGAASQKPDLQIELLAEALKTGSLLSEAEWQQATPQPPR